MGEKKRKIALGEADPPPKKSRKGSSTSSHAAQPSSSASITSTPTIAHQTRNTRKRAVDFLDEDRPVSLNPAKSVNRIKANGLSSADVLQNAPRGRNPPKKSKDTPKADGANGVGDSGAPEQSMLAEAIRTQDDEIEAEYGVSDDDDEDELDAGAALLAGFDSDTEDAAEDRGNLDQTPSIPNYKETSKKLRKATEVESDQPGTVYVGRIPHGFYETQMRSYFSQFGDIRRLRLSRNKRTGASKHFAFIEFASTEVAKIVAETMDNYLMFGHILKCKYAPAENLHPDTWKGANKKFRKIPHTKLERQRLEAPKTAQQWAKKNAKEQAKRSKKAERLKALGYEYTIPQLRDPNEVAEQRQLEQRDKAERRSTSQAVTAPENIEAPLAVTEPNRSSKKSQKAKQMTNGSTLLALTEHNLDLKNAKTPGTAKSAAEGVRPETRPFSSEGALDGGSTAGTSMAHKATTDDAATTTSATATTATKSARSKHARSDGMGDGQHLSQAGSDLQEVSGPGSADKGVFDSLSSIPVGGDLESYLPEHESGGQGDTASLTTELGVADAELKKRSKDRKRLKEASAHSDRHNLANTMSSQKREAKEKATGKTKFKKARP